MNLKKKLLVTFWKKMLCHMLRHAEDQIDLNSYDKELSLQIDALRYLMEVK